MIPIELTYQRKFLFARWASRISLSLPESWEEVPSNLKLKSFQILYQFKGDTARLRLFKLWTGIPKKLFKKIEHSDLLFIMRLMNWVRMQPDSRPILSSFTHGGVRYFLPASKFENGTAIEYPIADDYLNQFTQDPQREHLVKLTATLCRPENKNKEAILKNGDRRAPLLSRDEAEYRAKALDSLPDEILFAVHQYFVGVKMYIWETYKGHLFDEDKSNEDAPGPISFGWWGVYMDVAESGVYGDLDKVHQTNFHTICMYLVKKKSEANHHKQRMNFESARHEH